MSQNSKNAGRRAKFKYLIKGIVPSRESQQDLQRELHENLPNAVSVVILPVVEGYALEVEMADLAPFTEASFEPYFAEHVVPEAVSIHCQSRGPVQLQLLKAHYS